MTRFAGKTVLVTGAAQGMGRTIAERFVADGANVVLFDLDEDRLARTARDLAPSEHALAITGDVSRRDDVHRAVRSCADRFGRLDVLVAQAGIGDLEPLLDIDDHRWQRMIDVNLTGVFLSVQEAARAMAGSGGGAIVVTASTNAFFVEAHTAHYSATKGGVVTFVRAAALDLAGHGIRVNAVNPGIIRTRLSEVLTEDPVGGPAYLKRIPLGRFGETADIANAVLFLASDDAAYITGQDLTVDGGVTLGVTLDVPDSPLPGSPRARGEHGS